MKLTDEMGCLAIAAVSFLIGILVGIVIAYLILQTMPIYPYIHGPIA